MEMIVHLDNDIFKVVKQGIKCIEVRVNDEKRQKLSIGDKLIFLKRENENDKIITRVEDIVVYKNFKKLVKDYKIEEIYLSGYTKEYFLNKVISRFYTYEEIEKYGVVAIRFKIC